MRAHAPPTGPRAASTRPARGGRPHPGARRRPRIVGMSRRRPPRPHTGRSTPNALRGSGRSGRHTAARASPTADGTPTGRDRMPRPRSGNGKTTRGTDTGPGTHTGCTADTGEGPPMPWERTGRTGAGRREDGGSSAAPRRLDTRRPRAAPMPSPRTRTGPMSAAGPACATGWATPPP